jgi:uroporphyrin-III C-methyltransferase
MSGLPGRATLGRVTLVGGGPGSEDLMTVGAIKALAEADVVLYDRLAPHDRVAELAPGAVLINVGKKPGHHPISQTGIELLLIDHARAGAKVVRLKGGDPYVFGRGSEEVLACRQAGVPVRVIPGVTSAVSVPAAAGIPLTHRGVSHLFTVVSGHAPLSDDELHHLAGLGGTLVVLMGVSTLPHLVAGLQRHGASASLPVAIIERGYSETQKTTVADLDTVVSEAALAGVSAPAVIVIGEVVRLAHGGDSAAEALMRSAEMMAAPA